MAEGGIEKLTTASIRGLARRRRRKARDVKKLSPFAATEGRQMSRCSTQPRAGSA
jgi:hypothetical protein